MKKLFLTICVLFFLNGCIQPTALLGPSLTVAASGNIYKAGLQYGSNKIIEKKLSVRQTEKFVKVCKIKPKKFRALKDLNIQDLELSISEKIGLNVEIKNKKNNKGHIVFEYKDLDQLNKIIEIIKKNY